MFKTYGNKDKFSLSLQFHTCFSHFLPAVCWEHKKVHGNNSVLNSQRLNCLICYPHEGMIMIHSQNGICLRPIIMPYSDNASEGFVSDWISSAPLEWTMDQFGRRDRWNPITREAFSVVMCEIEHETNAVSQGFVFQFRDSVNRINTYPQHVIINIPNNTTNMTLH